MDMRSSSLDKQTEAKILKWVKKMIDKSDSTTEFIRNFEEEIEEYRERIRREF